MILNLGNERSQPAKVDLLPPVAGLEWKERAWSELRKLGDRRPKRGERVDAAAEV